MANILTHELSPNPLSFATVGGDINTTSKADLIGILTVGLIIPTAVPESNLSTCVLIDGHALIQAIGKPPECQTFGDYAEVFMKKVTRHFGEHTTRVDVVFDRYIGDNSIKAAIRSKRAAKKPIRMLVEGQHIPLPSVWSQFIGLDENKADLAKFLSQIIVTYGKRLPDKYELVSGGGFADATHVSSSKREDVGLHGNHEEADTRLILHSLDAINEGYKRLMISGTAKNHKCYPIHSVSEKQLKITSSASMR